jgi:hypothetical protein
LAATMTPNTSSEITTIRFMVVILVDARLFGLIGLSEGTEEFRICSRP